MGCTCYAMFKWRIRTLWSFGYHTSIIQLFHTGIKCRCMQCTVYVVFSLVYIRIPPFLALLRWREERQICVVIMISDRLDYRFKKWQTLPLSCSDYVSLSLIKIEQNMLPGMDLSGLLHATHLFEAASVTITRDLKQCDVNNLDAVNALNKRLSMTERQFLAEEGLPGRPWFKHILQVSYSLSLSLCTTNQPHQWISYWYHCILTTPHIQIYICE